MKTVIIMTGSLLLGCIIFQYIAGDEDSLRIISGAKMQELIQSCQEAHP